MAGGRWLRAGLGAATVVALGLITYVVVVRPIQAGDNPDPVSPSQAPRAAASLAPRSEGPIGSQGPDQQWSDPQKSGVPMPDGDLPGWRQVFTDDFDRSTLGPKWDVYTGQPDGDP